MNYKYTIPTLFIFTFFTIIQPTTAKNLSCNKEVDEIAQKITVLIDINNKDNGSGILIKQEGNTYTVLTAFHNVKNPSLKYTIITPDQQRYPIQNQNIQPLGTGIDLAVVKFVSSKTYQVAKFGNSDLIKRGDNVYVTGFRLSTPSIPAPLYDCFDGQVSAHATQVTIDGGYNLVYTNPTLKGMSGGPVLNSEGELIGIHGRGDEYDNRERDRFAGIPINIYVRIAANTPPNNPSPTNESTPAIFQNLEALLKAGKWRDADLETWNLMVKLTKREQKGSLRLEDVKNFPRQELRKMDQLWVKYSNGKFGFSVQKQIWLDLGGKLDGEPDWDTFKKLGDRVGWRKNNEWLYHDSYTFSTNALPGHLPTGRQAFGKSFLYDLGRGWVVWTGSGIFLFHRL
ncbi:MULTISPECIES: GUN4 domain-containing protein [Aphanizomenon]|uniref:GUN4 domain-containing protein n=2 Tax=Aphanizomenon flos-aquae TaxID=1176 RepID=A0ABR8IRU6_APHFL|nr:MULTISPECIES: GUN4 domain-containing protein [Aphanizomenon]MBD2389952.1 GUN4 domain-containing protein [Aphanizomenon flos-aquae FACHB-1171]MBD2556995.1 GUN4 domain-containing protein [Aphanizomenon flos-aquae FACHB-1290]MBD2631041.1 GUN4 domain-containing protein [Aphanizomenon sp. FACHB-1399]MBD2643643.1 GUN4 domain-containing protein [Aphanizomenon sp. FACHB-1401]MBD2658368.1 GUN4 domain-containing protein [Aphanizomenon flos-aquae FACHB-1265]